ncbi:sugar ABC transporter substrate-binding protein [Diplocloster agilis]|uniref:Sugar ABC transporter substrate-binding protein n=2 Tax=Diplocloster agilis TaxID=2850323 RepID=A0A949NHB8_9FIRM|nr:MULTISPECIES: sugar ABC transporter substrate-binding protein [Lachnospiraceae]MBU9738003.1 sugar ABC transporter substrate-binding protein [Diplocloster agilis]MBU9746062.1 sugar ABC transporter substrate-binding protein [Diplocloster agilis]MCU6734053.1 sugar ABC transporter substrate-binding protein [Suonthocola fibrivorans]SCJ20860.1 D-ribose-binding periplasmic protein precursor [uncultured Clostridium sp.]
MMKKSLCLVLSLVMVLLAAAGCGKADGSAQSPEKGGKKIAYTTMTLESPYFVEVSEGIKDKCQELGWECTVQDPKMDVASQLAAIETYIDQKYDGIIISAVDAAALPGIIKEATDAGIKVIGSSTDIENIQAFVSAGEYEMGYALGKAIGEWSEANLSGDLKGVTFGTINDQNVMIREQGMREGAEEAYSKGNITFINEAGTLGGVTAEEGMANMEGIMQSNPDINLIMGSNDDSILGAYEAAKSAGMDLNKMAFGGVNAVEQALNTIKEEKDAGEGAYRVTVDITPRLHGVTDVEIMQQLFDGKEFPEQVLIEAKAVTVDNIDEYFK